MISFLVLQMIFSRSSTSIRMKIIAVVDLVQIFLSFIHFSLTCNVGIKSC